MSEKSLFWSKDKNKRIEVEVNNYLDKCLSNEIISKYNETNKEYLKPLETYKKNHNKFFIVFLYFYFVLSLIIIFSFYWAYKKFKELKLNKDALKNNIENKGNEKLNVSKTMIKMIDFSKLEDIL